MRRKLSACYPTQSSSSPPGQYTTHPILEIERAGANCYANSAGKMLLRCTPQKGSLGVPFGASQMHSLVQPLWTLKNPRLTISGEKDLLLPSTPQVGSGTVDNASCPPSPGNMVSRLARNVRWKGKKSIGGQYPIHREEELQCTVCSLSRYPNMYYKTPKKKARTNAKQVGKTI